MINDKSSLDYNLDALKPGETFTVSKSPNGISVTAERSTDGRLIRFVRNYPNGSWTVFHTSRTR